MSILCSHFLSQNIMPFHEYCLHLKYTNVLYIHPTILQGVISYPRVATFCSHFLHWFWQMLRYYNELGQNQTQIQGMQNRCTVVGHDWAIFIDKFLPRGCFASSCWRSPVSLSPPPWRWGMTSSWSPASPVSVSVAGGSKQGRQEDLFAWTAGRPSWNCSKQWRISMIQLFIVMLSGIHTSMVSFLYNKDIVNHFYCKTSGWKIQWWFQTHFINKGLEVKRAIKVCERKMFNGLDLLSSERLR